MPLIVEPYPKNKSKLIGYVEHKKLSSAFGAHPFLVVVGDEDLWLDLQFLTDNDKIDGIWASGPNPPNKGWSGQGISYVTNLYMEGRVDEGIGAGETKFCSHLPDLVPYLQNNTSPDRDTLSGIQFLHPALFFVALQEVQRHEGSSYKYHDGQNIVWDNNGAGAFIVSLASMEYDFDLDTDEEKVSWLEDRFDILHAKLKRDFYFCYLVE